MGATCGLVVSILKTLGPDNGPLHSNPTNQDSKVISCSKDIPADRATSSARRLVNLEPYSSRKDVCVNRIHLTAGIPNTTTLRGGICRCYIEVQRGVVQKKSICGPAASIEGAEEPHYSYSTSLRRNVAKLTHCGSENMQEQKSKSGTKERGKTTLSKM